MRSNADVFFNERPKTGFLDLDRLNIYKSVFQILIFACVAVALGMDIPHTKPLKLAAVYLHEQGHALMTWITQGEVVGIRIYSDESGETESLQGHLASIQFAGYIFQCLIGAFCLASSYRQRSGARFCVLLGFVTIVSIIAFMGKSPDTPTMQCAMMIIIACVGTGFLCWTRPLWYIGSMILRIVGTFWSTYTLMDIYRDCFGSNKSDAHALSEQLGLVPWMYGIIFLSVGCASVAFASYWSALPEPQPEPVVRRAKVAVTPRM